MPKYYIQTFGCDMNTSDAERVSALLDELGFEKSMSDEDADLVVVHACSVRQSAIDRIHGKVRKWSKGVIKNGHKRVSILTGCVLPADKKIFKQSFDILLDIKEIPFLPEKLSHYFKDLDSNRISIQEYFHIKPKYSDPYHAYIPISTGCNQFCSYCAVPYTRGREVSRPMNKIIQEVRERIRAGTKIITLLGQNVNSYGLDWERQKEYHSGIKNHFVELLRQVNEIEGDFWVFFYSNHPKDVTSELLDLVIKSEKICNYIHLPLQAGNNDVLLRMNRTYTKEYYLDLVNEVYKIIPDVTLTTDIIVGFPGETQDQFRDTLEVCKKACFDMAFIAKYSPRPGSWAQRKYQDNVLEREKALREKAANEILKKTVLVKNKKLEKKTVRIFVDVLDEEKKKICGRTQGYKKVLLDWGAKVKYGQFIDVKITKAFPWALKGEIL